MFTPRKNVGPTPPTTDGPNLVKVKCPFTGKEFEIDMNNLKESIANAHKTERAKKAQEQQAQEQEQSNKEQEQKPSTKESDTADADEKKEATKGCPIDHAALSSTKEPPKGCPYHAGKTAQPASSKRIQEASVPAEATPEADTAAPSSARSRLPARFIDPSEYEGDLPDFIPYEDAKEVPEFLSVKVHIGDQVEEVDCAHRSMNIDYILQSLWDEGPYPAIRASSDENDEILRPLDTLEFVFDPNHADAKADPPILHLYAQMLE